VSGIPLARFTANIDAGGPQPVRPRQAVTSPQSEAWREYSFLAGPLLDGQQLAAAIAKALELQVQPHAVLLASGAVTPQDYAEAVAHQIGAAALKPGQPPPAPSLIIDATAHGPDRLAALVGYSAGHGESVVLASPDVIDSLEPGTQRTARLNKAVRGLKRIDPEMSATGPIRLPQLAALAALVGLVLGAGLIAPDVTKAAMLIGISVPFLVVVLFRSVVLMRLLCGNAHQSTKGRSITADRDLPSYSILVPLFREAAVLPDLVEALSRLDYPAAKLDCMLILEAGDSATIAVARAMTLPPFMRIVVVPDCAPRTKPKALNYAMQLARGEIVAIFDAEDVPDPQQLRKAVGAFAAGGPDLVCVQASLAIHNARDSWLTRQFALEYAALFEGLLPTLARFHLPVPLGGTSNHFRRSFLVASGGWDPHNVTEDADLGIRIARAGGRVATIRSLTWEEAPARLKPWIGQRTRWLKGWMQTYLVHMRQPLRLWRDLGFIKFISFQALLGGVLLSSLFYPLAYLWMAWEIWHGEFLMAADSALHQGFVMLAGFNLIAGFTGTMAIAAIAITRAGSVSLAPYVLLMPVYWLLVSWAAWRAVVQLIVAPHFWEKTEHSARRRRR
jgi:glycosyltransferase XagB